MADYCTVSDIEVILGYDEGFLNETTKPKKSNVEREIDQTTNEIDFYLEAGGITTQPTDTKILSRLRNCCVMGVAWKVGFSNFGNNNGVDNSQPSTYQKQYEACIQQIIDQPELFSKITNEDVAYIENQVSDGTTTEEAQLNNYIDQNYEV